MLANRSRSPNREIRTNIHPGQRTHSTTHSYVLCQCPSRTKKSCFSQRPQCWQCCAVLASSVLPSRTSLGASQPSFPKVSQRHVILPIFCHSLLLLDAYHHTLAHRPLDELHSPFSISPQLTSTATSPTHSQSARVPWATPCSMSASLPLTDVRINPIRRCMTLRRR